MSGTRRLTKEYNDLQSSKLIQETSVKDLAVSEQSILSWSGALNPSDVKFFTFSLFRRLFFRHLTIRAHSNSRSIFPPIIRSNHPKFWSSLKSITPISMTRVKSGKFFVVPISLLRVNFSLPIISPENWKPATRVEHVLMSLLGWYTEINLPGAQNINS